MLPHHSMFLWSNHHQAAFMLFLVVLYFRIAFRLPVHLSSLESTSVHTALWETSFCVSSQNQMTKMASPRGSLPLCRDLLLHFGTLLLKVYLWVFQLYLLNSYVIPFPKIAAKEHSWVFNACFNNRSREECIFKYRKSPGISSDGKYDVERS